MYHYLWLYIKTIGWVSHIDIRRLWARARRTLTPALAHDVGEGENILVGSVERSDTQHSIPYHGTL
jgi:hypothetical protein